MMLVSKRELSELLGLSERHLDRLIAAGVLPPRTAKGFALKGAIRGYVSFLKSNSGGVATERARLLKFQADLTELKLRERTGELVELAEVESQVFTNSRRIRDAFLNLPPRTAGLVAAESNQHTCFDILNTEVLQILTGLANGRQKDRVADSHTKSRPLAEGRGPVQGGPARRHRRHRGPD